MEYIALEDTLVLPVRSVGLGIRPAGHVNLVKPVGENGRLVRIFALKGQSPSVLLSTGDVCHSTAEPNVPDEIEVSSVAFKVLLDLDSRRIVRHIYMSVVIVIPHDCHS